MDDFDQAVQPHCPDCGIVMRTTPGAYQCPHCGHLELIPHVKMPPEFDGPDIDQRR